MADDFIGVVVSVPEDIYDPETCDGLGYDSGKYICSKLEPYLIEHGHSIPDYLSGGGEEDWGIYFASQQGERRYAFMLNFYPEEDAAFPCAMLVIYCRRKTFWEWLFRKSDRLSPDDTIHATMRNFGQLFEASRMITRSEFDPG